MLQDFYLVIHVSVLTEDDQGYDGTGRAIYLEACRNAGVVPASYFLRHMFDTCLDMKHHGLGPCGTKPISVALVVSVR